MSNATAAHSDLVIALVTLFYALGQFFGLLVTALLAGQDNNANTPSSYTTSGLDPLNHAPTKHFS
ncbi:hypothetical protein ACTXGL_00470 [Psychrobacter sp. T6-6]|uniref:hypothetical protein n=1 Tax=unclassified Psychrobacter TaxID=196806 RepID=UPI0029BE9523|nr:hypothetical protein [Psychrobacter sp. PP-21]MDX2372993.1 hypothetical protein [Psychrobacter sp. PP-21]